MTSRKQRIIQALTEALQPNHLAVRDISHTHAGHAGAGTETHFTVEISSPHLKGQNRVEQHRRVNAALAAEFESGLHALSITVI
jgi:BolA protein